MPTDPASQPILTVAPVVDYEPPARPTAACRTAHPAPLPPPVRSLRAHPPRNRQDRPDRPARPALPAALRSAAVFADAALRRVLEVVDQRRPPTHLHPLLAAGLAESVLAMRPRTPTGRGGPATLQRVRVQPAGAGEPPTAVEVFGTFRRGARTHALACRVESVPRPGKGLNWQIVALHIG
ncbi:Rv3235 family protein [Mycolicibacter minnesotensis]